MAKIDKSALLTLREQFESVCPDFRTFDHPGEGRAKEELASRRTALDEVKAAVAEGETDQAIGKSVIEILQKGGNKRSPLVDVHTERKIKARHPQILGEFHTAIGRLVQSDQGTEEALQRAFSALDDLEFEGQRHKLSYGVRINFVFSALAMARPHEAAPLQIRRINNAWEKLTGEELFVDGQSNWVSDYRRFAAGFSELFQVMRDEWEWQPRDWLDVQGFLWIANESSGENEEATTRCAATVMPLNRILYGPPGTGKTYKAMRLALSIIDNDYADDENFATLFEDARFTEPGHGQIAMITFHQNFAYEDFVEGIRPVLDSDDADLRYELRDGLFKRIVAEASDYPNYQHVLIIDEINRGNIAKIFGELITLIEDSRREGQSDATSVTLPYSQDDFTVPSNLYLIGTMNTADRSIQLLDTALRRRFAFVECMPEPDHDKVPKDIQGINCQTLLRTLNERILLLLDREHQIGHTYFFIKEFDQLVKVFQNKIVPLLQEYFFDDWAKIRAVLGNNRFVHEDEQDQSFLKAGLNYLVDENRKAYRLSEDKGEKSVWREPEEYRCIYDDMKGRANSG